MRGYTSRQREILTFIEARLLVTEKSPTLREIQAHFRLRSIATVHKHLISIQKKGGLQQPRYGHRGIQLLASPSGAITTA